MEEILLSVARADGFSGSLLELKMHMAEQKERSETAPLAAWTTIKQWFDLDGPAQGIPLPGWCMQYLFEVSTGIQSLRATIESITRDEGEIRIVHKPRRTPKELAEAVIQILGFVRHGWNVFDADERDLKDTAAALAYESFRRKGDSGREAIERVMAILCVADERSARRAIKRGKTKMYVLPGQFPGRR